MKTPEQLNGGHLPKTIEDIMGTVSISEMAKQLDAALADGRLMDANLFCGRIAMRTAMLGGHIAERMTALMNEPD